MVAVDASAGPAIAGAISGAATGIGAALAGVATGLSSAISGAAGSIVGGLTAHQTQLQTMNTANNKLLMDNRLEDKAKAAADRGDDKKDAFTKWWEAKKERYKRFFEAVQKFLKVMAIVARFWPFIKICIAIIIIFSNLLFYVVMIFAYIGAAILEIIYFILSFPPFIQILGFIYLALTDGVVFLLYTFFMGVLLAIISIGCLILAFLNEYIFGGRLKFLILCQNGPANWYKVPNWHTDNRFMRGFLCSKPCRKGFVPEPSGTNCVRQPKEMPFYCPQAQIMRFYTGDGKKDRRRWAYKDKRVKGNMKYLSKTPPGREEELLDYFVNKSKYMTECGSKDNPYGSHKYTPMLLNICANIDAYHDKSFINMEPKIMRRLQKVCNQSFCDSQETYPFCSKPGLNSEDGTSELIKRIVIFILSLICFTLAVMFMFAYMNEEVQT